MSPDHFFEVRFLPSQAMLLPVGFVVEGSQRFIDQRTFDALKSMRESGIESNIYITSSIDIRDETLILENTYARHEVGETEFLMAVCQSAILSLQEWRIFAGGGGYDSTEVARGEDAASFLEYLKLEHP